MLWFYVSLAANLAPATVSEATAPTDEWIRGVGERASALLGAGRTDEALQVLEEAAQVHPVPAFLYMRATLEERRGHCEEAIALYREFLRQDVPAVDAGAAREGLQRCGASPEAVAPTPEPAESVVEVTEPTPPPVPEQVRPSSPPRRSWAADPAAGVLLGIGTAALAAGAGVYARGKIDEATALEADTLARYDTLAPRAERLGQAGIALLAIGPTLIVGAVVRYAVVARRARSSSRDARLRGAIAAGGWQLQF